MPNQICKNARYRVFLGKFSFEMPRNPCIISQLRRMFIAISGFNDMSRPDSERNSMTNFPQEWFYTF